MTKCLKDPTCSIFLKRGLSKSSMYHLCIVGASSVHHQCINALCSSGPSGIKIFNPGIFRDGIMPNPGIPGFFGTGFTLIFNPGIVQKFLRDFSGFLFLLRVLVKSHNFHQSLSLSFSPPHPQEGSTMSAQHMKRLSQMLPQILTN